GFDDMPGFGAGAVPLDRFVNVGADNAETTADLEHPAHIGQEGLDTSPGDVLEDVAEVDGVNRLGPPLFEWAIGVDDDVRMGGVIVDDVEVDPRRIGAMWAAADVQERLSHGQIERNGVPTIAHAAT